MTTIKKFRKDEPVAVKMPRQRMNKSEAAYALRLEAMKRNGYIDGYEFQGMKFKLATGAYYTPDFAVWRRVDVGAGFIIECHEVKGFMREAARVRLLVAAKTYPCITFKLCRLGKGGWQITEIER